jgi:thymidylate kinase
VLDSFVRLRFLYGEQRRFRAQRALITLLSPRPKAAFLLDIDAEASLTRKDDKWSAEELATQVRLYREEHERAGVTRLDGRRDPDELAAEIAAQVWRRL